MGELGIVFSVSLVRKRKLPEVKYPAALLSRGKMQETTLKQITLVLGGVRSGKSRFAQQLAVHVQSVGYIATAQSTDAEMQAKIERHQKERPETWCTIEEPLDLDGALVKNGDLDVLLVDCLTVFAANLLMAEDDAGVREVRVNHLCHALIASRASIILVSNEVGSGVVPPYPLGRAYRDFLGELNQRVAVVADTVVLMVAGLPLVLKGKLEHYT
jgi:adenosylcobinamide kinase/adenosylcobinamide-phosphate guanylyltransferase